MRIESATSSQTGGARSLAENNRTVSAETIATFPDDTAGAVMGVSVVDVYGRPGVGAEVAVDAILDEQFHHAGFHEGRSASGRAIADGDGRARLGPFPTGLYLVRAGSADGGSGSARFALGTHGAQEVEIVLRAPDESGPRSTLIYVEGLSGQPLGEADVRVLGRVKRDEFPDRRTQELRARTSGAGVARLDGVSVVEALVTVRYQGREFTTGESTDDNRRNVRYVVRELPRGGIRGRVSDQNGEPIADLELTAYSISKWSGFGGGWRSYLSTVSQRITDSEGGFAFQNLSPGSYIILPKDSPWYVPRPLQKRGREDVPNTVDSEPVVVEPGEITRHDLALDRGGTFRGRVVFRDSGEAVSGSVKLLYNIPYGLMGRPGFRIRRRHQDEMSQIEDPELTATVPLRDGEFEFRGLRPGDYYFEVLSPRAASLDWGVTIPPEASTVTREFRVAAAGSLHGFSPTGLVGLKRVGSDQLLLAQSSIQYFLFPRVPPGDYDVVRGNTFGRPWQPTFGTVTVRRGRATFADFRSFEDPYFVHGSVSGLPPGVEASVSLYRRTSPVVDGVYRVSIPSRSYAWPGIETRLRYGGLNWRTEGPFADQDSLGTRIDLNLGAEELRIECLDGTSPVPFSFGISGERSPNETEPRWYLEDSRGFSRDGLPVRLATLFPGTYRVTATFPDNTQQTRSVTLPRDEPLRFSHRLLASLRVTIVDNKGRPWPGLEIAAGPADEGTEFLEFKMTLEDGSARFSSLEPGNVRVYLRDRPSASWQSETRPLLDRTVHGGVPDAVEYILDPGK